MERGSLYQYLKKKRDDQYTIKRKAMIHNSIVAKVGKKEIFQSHMKVVTRNAD